MRPSTTDSPATMKAIVQDRYGPPAEVLELREIDKPVPKDDEVLVRVHAASVHPDVWHAVTGLPYVLRFMGSGVAKPKNPVPGTAVAGRVEAVGRNVTRSRPGDEVFGETLSGHQWQSGGAYAEYVTVAEDALASKPNNITMEQAAAVPTSALIALHNLRGEELIQPGQRVLVNGAAGGVGMFALQIAKAYGDVGWRIAPSNSLFFLDYYKPGSFFETEEAVGLEITATPNAQQTYDNVVLDTQGILGPFCDEGPYTLLRAGDTLTRCNGSLHMSTLSPAP